MDSSALRYFSDSSREKTLPPLAAAELALALTMNGDDEAARFWLDQARRALPDQITAQSATLWPTLAALAENALSPPRDIAALAENAAKSDLSLAPLAAAARLRLVETLAQRVGVWHLGVNGPIRNLTGLYVASLRDKNAPQALRMAANETAYLLQIETNNAVASSAKDVTALSVQRQLYRLDGTMIGAKDKLTQGQTYMLTLHGQGRGGTGDNILVAPLNAGLEAVALGSADSAAYAASWPWLPPLAAWRGVMATPSRLIFAMPPAESWRMATLVRAGQKGAYILPPVTMQDQSGTPIKPASPPFSFQVE